MQKETEINLSVETDIHIMMRRIGGGGRCHNLKNGKEASEVRKGKFSRMRWGR